MTNELSSTMLSCINKAKAKDLAEILKNEYGEVPVGWSGMNLAKKRERVVEMATSQPVLAKALAEYYGFEEGSEIYASLDGDEILTQPTGDVKTGDPVLSEDDTPTPSTGTTTVTVSETTGIATSYMVETGSIEDMAAQVAGLSAADSFHNLTDLCESMEATHFAIGALLDHIQSKELYLEDGLSNMGEAIAKYTSLDYRKATYLLANFRTARELGIPAEKWKSLSWTKMREVLPALTKDNYHGWLDFASENTVSAIKAQVSAHKQSLIAPPKNGDKDGAGKDAGGEVSEQQVSGKPLAKTYSVQTDELPVLESAILKAKAEGEVDTDSQALLVMAASYAGTPTTKSAKPDTSDDGMTAYAKAVRELDKKGEPVALIALLTAISEAYGGADINLDSDSIVWG